MRLYFFFRIMATRRSDVLPRGRPSTAGRRLGTLNRRTFVINVVQVSDCIDLEKRAPVMAKNKSGGSGAQRHSGRDEGRERELLAPWGAHLHPPVLNMNGANVHPTFLGIHARGLMNVVRYWPDGIFAGC